MRMHNALGDKSELRQVEEAPLWHPPVLGLAAKNRSRLQGVVVIKESLVFVCLLETLLFILTLLLREEIEICIAQLFFFLLPVNLTTREKHQGFFKFFLKILLCSE